MQSCARHQWITRATKTNSLSSFSSSGSKLNSTLVQYKKQTLHQNSLLHHSNCNILSVERNKLEKSTFEFPSTAKSQTLGKLASRCVLKSTSSFLSTQVNENKFEQQCNSFPWLQGQSTKGKLFVSFKYSFHHFKSSAEAIQLKEPLVAKQHF